MSETKSTSRGVLYVIVCASRPAQRVQDFVVLAQAASWDVCVIATPQATKFVDTPLLEKLTGHPVRSEYKRPEEPDVLPRANAIVVFPATFNTINKWALGISDTLALGLLCEYMGLGMPILAIPCILTASGLDSHPAFFKSMEFLRACGVYILYEPDKYPPKNEVPWEVILDELDKITKRSDRDSIAVQESAKEKNMILHTVLLQPKTESTPQDIQRVLDQVRSLQQSIPGITDVQVGENLSDKHQGYTYGFVMHFVDEAHLKAYAPHPSHQVVSNEIRRLCSSVIDFDLRSNG
jgi:hypothetical protein